MNEYETLEAENIDLKDEVAEDSDLSNQLITLKAQLAKAIVPKFEVGQEVVFFDRNAPEDGTKKVIIADTQYYSITMPLNQTTITVPCSSCCLFATQAEALKSLEGKDE